MCDGHTGGCLACSPCHSVVMAWLQVLSAQLPGDPGLLGTHARALEAFARLVPARPELLPRIIQKVLAVIVCILECLGSVCFLLVFACG